MPTSRHLGVRKNHRKNPLNSPPTGRKYGEFEKGKRMDFHSKTTKNNIRIPTKKDTNVTDLPSQIGDAYMYPACPTQVKTLAPMSAPIKAVIPKRLNREKSKCFAISDILKMLFAKCTKAVAKIASSIGKYRLKTGSKMVPSPKPEKKVAKAPSKQTMAILISLSIFLIFVKNNRND
jgi:hypothetical protein